MGLWDRIRGIGPGGYRERKAAALERAGQLSGAVEAFLAAGLPEEAGRLQLVRAEGEREPAKRLLLLRTAAQMAPGSNSAQEAAARAAKLRYELARGRGAVLRAEVLGAAEELLAASEYRLAAEAFAEAGDHEREVQALVQAGALAEVEAKLEREIADAREGNEVALAIRTAQDLDRSGERRKALALAARFPDDSTLRDFRTRLEQRLLRGPTADVVIAGTRATLAFGPVFTIGRGESTCVVPSPQLSRVHLELFRDDSGAPCVRDLDTKNGTFLGGARVGGALPVGAGIRLSLGGEVACEVVPHVSGGVRVEVAGHSMVASLGPLFTPVGEIAQVVEGGHYIVLRRGKRQAFLAGLEVAPEIELAHGDKLSSERSGAPQVELLMVGGRAG